MVLYPAINLDQELSIASVVLNVEVGMPLLQHAREGAESNTVSISMLRDRASLLPRRGIVQLVKIARLMGILSTVIVVQAG